MFSFSFLMDETMIWNMKQQIQVSFIIINPRLLQNNNTKRSLKIVQKIFKFVYIFMQTCNI